MEREVALRANAFEEETVLERMEWNHVGLGLEN
jgi:hypothetical protein